VIGVKGASALGAPDMVSQAVVRLGYYYNIEVDLTVAIDNHRSSLNIKPATTLKAISEEREDFYSHPHHRIIHPLLHIDNTNIKLQAVKEKKRDSNKLQWSTKKQKSQV